MNSFAATKSVYDDAFFDYVSIGSMRSAAIVAPLVLQHYKAASLVDIGCGRGAWLLEWQRAGLVEYLGIDGDYAGRDGLLIPDNRFASRDLTEPFDVGRRFDLVVSLEVGEHIRPDATEIFVDNLCNHSDAILFSAAVPGQGGTSHLNEQSYGFWRKRFAERGYRLFDFIRPALATRREVEPWYRYNSLFFARSTAIDRLSEEARAAEIGSGDPVPDYSSIPWRLRKAAIRRLPASVSDRLVELKHRFVLLRRK